MKNKLAAIEGILFSMGTSVTRRQLMEALEIDNEQFDELIKLLQQNMTKKREESGYWNWMMLISFVPKQNIMDH